jgi:hypothetical protein
MSTPECSMEAVTAVLSDAGLARGLEVRNPVRDLPYPLVAILCEPLFPASLREKVTHALRSAGYEVAQGEEFLLIYEASEVLGMMRAAYGRCEISDQTAREVAAAFAGESGPGRVFADTGAVTSADDVHRDLFPEGHPWRSSEPAGLLGTCLLGVSPRGPVPGWGDQ